MSDDMDWRDVTPQHIQDDRLRARWTTLVEASQRYDKALAEFHVAVADYERRTEEVSK